MKTQVQLLGGFGVTPAGQMRVAIKGHKAQCALAFVLYNSGRMVRRPELVDLLWHDRSEEQGRASLRQALYEIRAALGDAGDAFLNFGRDGIEADPDAIAFDLWDGAKDQINLDNHGELLSGLDPATSVFDEWVMDERRHLDARRLSAAETVLGQCSEGTPERAQAAERVLRFDPCNEAAAEIAMREFALSRSFSQVARVYSDIKAATEALGFELGDHLAQTFETLKSRSAAPQPSPLQPQPLPPGVPIIAVEPFEVRGDPGEDHLGLGLQEEVIGRLTILPELRVLSDDEGHKIKAAEDSAALAAQLGADYLLSGTLTVQAGQVRLRLRLAQTGQNTQVWSDQRTIEKTDLLDGVERLVDGLATTLLPAVEWAETRRIETTAPANYIAYDHYLKAKHIFFLAESPRYIEEAEAHLEEAIAHDPSFSPAYVHLIQSLNTGRIFSRPGIDLAEGRARALVYADRLLKLDRRNANGHLALAWCLLWKQQYQAAERSLEEAMRLKPLEAHRLNSIGTALLYLGRKDDAEAYYGHSHNAMVHDLDFMRTDYGELYYLKRDYEEARSFLDFGENRLAMRNQFWRAITLAQLDLLAEGRAEITRFLASVESTWAGTSEFAAENALQWLLQILPLRLQIDRDHVAGGLAKLGYDVAF